VPFWNLYLEIPIKITYPGPATLFLDFLLIGIQSFGGGSSTFSLIHQAAIKRGWLTEEEFVRSWALVHISPGINLVKLTVMIGYRLQGWMGILAAVSGMLLPSSIVTVLMTASFTTVRSISWVQAIMKGILPAAIGLSFAMCVQMAQPVYKGARHSCDWFDLSCFMEDDARLDHELERGIDHAGCTGDGSQPESTDYSDPGCSRRGWLPLFRVVILLPLI